MQSSHLTQRAVRLLRKTASCKGCKTLLSDRLLGNHDLCGHYDVEIDVPYDALGVVPGVSTDKHCCRKLTI